MEGVMHVTLIGAGGMGEAAMKAASQIGGIKGIEICDRDHARAAAVAASLQSLYPCKVSATELDVTDSAALAEILSRTDVVMNAAGPFFRFGTIVLRQAIDAGVDYIDICDDWEPTLEMLDLDSAAKEAGVTALIGMGASPGASNLLAMMAIRELDTVKDLYTCWGVDSDSEHADKIVTAALVHWVHQLTGEIKIAQNGKLVSAKPLEEIEIDIPGLGAGSVYSVGHPEPVTQARHSMAIGSCINAMVMPRQMIALLKTVREDVEAGLISVEEGAAVLISPDDKRELRATEIAQHLREPGSLPHFFAFATGERAGRQVKVAALVNAFPKGMAKATGVPMSIGLQALVEQKLLPGVHAPEAAIDPVWFFDRLAPFCSPPLKGSADLVTVITAPK